MKILKNVTAAALTFVAANAAFAAKPVSNLKVEQAIIDVTDTSDLYASKLNRRGEIVCSGEVEVDQKVFRFRVDSGHDDSEIEIEFDKVTSRVTGNSTQNVTFTKLNRGRNSLRIEFVVTDSQGGGVERGVLEVSLRRDTEQVTGAKISLQIGHRKLSCDGDAS